MSASGPFHTQQDTPGNQTIQRFAQSCPAKLPTPNVCPYGGACHKCPAPKVQSKLKIGRVDDEYEREADRVADQVMRMPDAQSGNPVTSGPLGPLQIHEPVRRDIAPQIGEPSTPDIESSIQVQSGCGLTICPRTREYFESRLDADFSMVRLHTDGRADKSTQALNARAFTLGRNIFFAKGQYRPDTPAGRHLLAHELVHVLQQNFKPLASTQSATSTSGWLQRRCLPNNIASNPILNCPHVLSGSASYFVSEEAASEEPHRRRRRRLAAQQPNRPTPHGGRALQLEAFMQSEEPHERAQIEAIHIDSDLGENSAAYTYDCDSLVGATIPAASRYCIFVPGNLNREAYTYQNTTSARIGGVPREEWRIETLHTLVHEATHARGYPWQAGFPNRATCSIDFCEPPDNRICLRNELDELGALIGGFRAVLQNINNISDPVRRRQYLENSYEWLITSCGQSVAGTLKAMRSLTPCSCADIDHYVQAIFDAVTSTGWNQQEKDAFNAELRNPRWNPWHINWPIAPSNP
jgi:hypothetical protein